jgi:hypothetical protein
MARNIVTVSKVIVGLFFASFVLMIFLSRATTNGFSHDEYQFVSSGQLLAGHGLLPYRDYPFLHMPYQVFINGQGVLLTPYHFLILRALTALAYFLSVCLISGLLAKKWRKLGFLSTFLIIGMASTFFITNPSLITMDGRALNHAFPILFSILAYFFYQSASEKQNFGFFIGLSGFFAAIATGFRLSYAVLLPAFALGILINSSIAGLRKKTIHILYFFTGAFFGLLPVVWMFSQWPAEFIYGNYTYIRLNTIYRELLGHATAMSPIAKVEFFANTSLNQFSSVLLHALTGILSVKVIYEFIRRKITVNNHKLTLLMVGVSLFAASFSATPIWPQYFFAPIPFFILFLFLTIEIKPNFYKYVPWVSLSFILLMLIINKPYEEIYKSIKSAADPQNWIPIQVHNYSQDLKQIVPEGKILTLSTSFPLEAGIDTYPIYAIGPFSWRTAPILAKETRERVSIIAPEDLDDYLLNDPPSAILVGFEANFDGFVPNDPGGLETPFVIYAKENGYAPISIDANFVNLETTIWVKNP